MITFIPLIFKQKLQNEFIGITTLKNLLLTLRVLKTNISTQYNILSCLSGVDLLTTKVGTKLRFCVCYELLSTIYNTRFRLKVFLHLQEELPSAVTIYKNINWWERELWDMFGIWVFQHPDLRRILTDYGFDGFPLRKDFPLTGYYEVLFSVQDRRIISVPINLAQEFRTFSFTLNI